MNNKRVNAFVTALFILLLCCCKSDDSTVRTIDMNFETIPTNETLGIICDLRIKGDTLLTNQFHGDHFLNWFCLVDGHLIKSDLSRGEAYKEMQGPLLVNMIGDSLVIIDRSRRSIYKSDFMCDTLIRYVDSFPFWCLGVFSLSDGKTIFSKLPYPSGNSECDETRFAVFVNDSVTGHFGQYPDFTASDVNSNAQQKAHFHQTASLCELPDKRFVAAASHVLSLYSYENGDFELIKEVVVSPYEYKAKPATERMGADTKLEDGYDAGLSRELIYHSEKLFVPYKNAEGISIYCYDTELNLLGVIVPSVPIMYPFAIDDNGKIVALVEKENSTNICVSEKSVNDIF